MTVPSLGGASAYDVPDCSNPHRPGCATRPLMAVSTPGAANRGSFLPTDCSAGTTGCVRNPLASPNYPGSDAAAERPNRITYELTTPNGVAHEGNALAFADIDNDGDLDLFVASGGCSGVYDGPLGHPSSPPYSNQLFLNVRGKLVEATFPQSSWWQGGDRRSTAAAFADYDGDGAPRAWPPLELWVSLTVRGPWASSNLLTRPRWLRPASSCQVTSISPSGATKTSMSFVSARALGPRPSRLWLTGACATHEQIATMGMGPSR